MTYPIETTLKEIVKRINDVCKTNNIAKEYSIYFKDEQIRSKLRTQNFKFIEGYTEADYIKEGTLVDGSLKYGVHLIFQVKDLTKEGDTGVSQIWKQSYLCKDYKDYIKSTYKLTLLNTLLYECVLIGGINMEAEMKMKKLAEDKKKVANNDIPVMQK